MRRSARGRGVAALAVAGLLAIVPAGARGETPPAEDSPFPRPEALEDLTEEPLPDAGFDVPMAVVETWTLEGPFPDVAAAAAYREPSDWGALLEVETARRAGLVVSTEAMHCAAREWGRFFLANGAPPGPSLTSWIGARCSAMPPRITFHHFEGGVPAKASESEIFEGWQPAVQALLAENLVGGPRAAGIWFGRREKRAVAVVASGERLLRLDPFATVLEGDGSFELSGEVLVAAEGVEASLNRGPYGVSDCERHPSLELPRFAFRCQADPEDAESWLSVSITPPGRILGRSALGLVLWPSGKPHATWQRPGSGAPLPIGPETRVGEEVTRLVNGVREQAGLEPLQLSSAQSRVAEELAPYYFASVFGMGPARTGDLVIMGLIAGWSVDGIVKTGGFASSWLLRSLDLRRLVATALQYPSGRRALLDPEARRLAVGAVVRTDTSFLAGIFGTYTVFEEGAQDDASRRVLAALDAARAERGKAPAHHLPAIASLSRLAAARVQEGEPPSEVLNDLLQQSTRVLNRSVNGWFLETRDLAEISFPTALLERDEARIAIGVSHHRPQGEPWGRYVVLLVAAGAEGRGA